MENKQFRKLLKLLEGTNSDRDVFWEFTKKSISHENWYDLMQFYFYHLHRYPKSDLSDELTDYLWDKWYGGKSQKIKSTKWYKKWKNEQNI